MGISNEDFAARLRIHYSTASRLRSGERSPSLALFADMVRVFGLDPAEALEEYHKGKPAFSAYLARVIPRR